MNSIIYIFLTALFTLLPFAYYNRKELKSNLLQVLAFGILGLAVTFLIAKFSNSNGYYLEMIVTSLLCTVFNYFAARGDIEIKLVPKSIMILMLFFFSSLLQLLIIPFLGWNLEQLTNYQILVLTAFSDLILLILLLCFYFKSLKEEFKNLKGNINKFLDVGIKYWLLGLVVMVCSNLIIGILTPAKAVNEEMVQSLIHSQPLISIIAIGIFAPMIEELTFRKAFRDIFKNDLAFILTSGLVFGALHVVLSFNSFWDLLYIIPYSSLGIAFATMYAKTNCIYTSTFMHMFHNTGLIILSIIMTNLGVILL